MCSGENLIKCNRCGHAIGLIEDTSENLNGEKSKYCHCGLLESHAGEKPLIEVTFSVSFD